MAQTIKLKRSATQGAAPSTSNLALGEVAINTYDGKMYIKKDVDGTESIVEVGGGSTVSYLEAGMIEYEYTATSNQTTFSGSDSNSATLSYTANSIMVFLNGVLQDDGVDYTATNGTSVVFSSALTANDEVRIVAFTNVTTSAGLNNPTKLDAITTVNSQAAYSLTLNSSAYAPSSQNALIVSLNGITQEPGDSFTISGSTITFSPALVTGDVVDYIVDMGRAVTIGEYSGDLAVGGELEVTGDIIGDIRGAILFKAQAGETLAKGDVVYISGISGNTTVVSKADADDSAKMPAFGVVSAAASSGTPVDIYTFGTLSGLDTSSFSEGDELFVSTTAGILTNSAPTGESAQIQKIAKVTRSDNSAGSIKIMGAGRSNATPNLDDGDIFIGNASNQAVTASLNTKIEDYLDGGTSTPVFSTINSGNITTTGYIAGPSTFTIDPAAVGDNTGTLVVAGNLQVDGTTTTINSTTMTVDDLNITLASGAANAAAANGAGITVDGASATLTYNSTPDAWSFNKNLGIGTASPDADLEIRKDNASGLGAVLSLTNSNSSGLTGNSVAIGLSAYAHTTIDSASYRGAIIRSKTTAAGNGHSIIFETSDTSLVPAERMIIDHNGNVGIGTDSPADELEIEGVDPAIRWDDTSAGGYARLEATNGSMVYEADQGNTVANSTHIFKIDSDEKMRIDSSGRLLIGTTSRETSGGERQFQIEGINGVTSSQSIVRNQNSASGPSLTLGKTRSASVGGSTTVVDGDTLGQVTFAGADGTDLNTVGASIKSNVDGTPASNNMPANLIFSVNSGSASESEAMRISANGQLKIGGTTNSPANVPAVLFGTGNASLIYNTGHTGLHINNENATAGDGNYGAGISFGRFASNSDDQSAAIVPVQTTADEDHMGIAFLTHDTNTRANPVKEKMRITGAGNVGIGTTSPDAPLTVQPQSGVVGTHDNQSWSYSISAGAEFDLKLKQVVSSGLVKYTFDLRNAGTSYNNNLVLDRGNVGIGTSSPSYKLDVDIGAPASSDQVLGRFSSQNGVRDIGFVWDDSTSTLGIATLTNHALTFHTNGNSNERMRIDSSGNVGIGISSVSPVISSSKTLQVSSSGNTTLSVRAIDSVNDRSAILELLSSGNGLSKSIILYGDTDTSPSTASPLVIQKYHSGARTEVGRFNTSGHLVLGDSTTAYYRLKSGATGTDGGIQWMFNTDATVFGSLTLPYDSRATTGLHLYSGYPITYTVPSNKAHQFITGSSEAARIDADGMKFNGDTAAANALDDYEEGTFTPTFTYSGGTGTGSWTYSNRTGRYTKIGNVCYYAIDIRFSSYSKGTASGQPQISDLPFTPANFANYNRVQTSVVLYQWPYTTNDGYFPGGSPQQQGSINRIDLSMNRPNLASVYLDDPDANSMIFASGYYYTV